MSKDNIWDEKMNSHPELYWTQIEETCVMVQVPSYPNVDKRR